MSAASILYDPADALETTYSLTSSRVQNQFLDALFSGQYNLLAMGGGIRGTKTFTMLIAVTILCKLFPGSRWAIVRKDLPTLRRNTIPSITKINMMSGGFWGEVKQGTWTYTCKNGSEVILFPESFSTDPDLDRWKGLEVNGIILEEANELNEASKNKAIERAGAYTIPDPARAGRPALNQPKPFVACTFNPCFNWPKTTFFDPYVTGTLPSNVFYQPATLADNPWASGDYRESLKSLPETEYRRFVLGDWTQSDEPDQLIKFEWIVQAKNREQILGLRKLGWDAARFGDDKSIGFLLDGNTIAHIEVLKGFSTTRQAAIISSKFINGAEGDHLLVPEENVRIDSVGLGAGVIDTLHGDHYNCVRVRGIESGGAPILRGKRDEYGNLRPATFFKYRNIRSQMAWEFRERMRTGLIALPDQLPDQLVTDMLSIRYRVEADKMIAIPSKEEIRKKLKRSPDFFDAYVMADFELPPMTTNSHIPTSYGFYSYN